MFIIYIINDFISLIDLLLISIIILLILMYLSISYLFIGKYSEDFVEAAS